MNELESLRRTVEMMERVRVGIQKNLMRRAIYSVSLLQSPEYSASELAALQAVERRLAEAKFAYREAYLRWRVLADCSKDDPGPVQDRSSDSPAEGS